MTGSLIGKITIRCGEKQPIIGYFPLWRKATERSLKTEGGIAHAQKNA
jgi:hypothetical protein